ncbi:Variant-specific surface protein [Giardia duodenalis]|uniref:Variant-specific surface protein n=1 Tax=Giardia intestinalis TaxID=5741 RepID=V6TSF1_GIAIN|nr:Variant-specific surface protein [Giardia intestinalis]
MVISGAELCRECNDGSVPIDGVCKETSDPSITSYGCAHTDGTGYCASCKADSATYFPFYGGCYAIDKAPGNLICSKAKNGKCTKCRKATRSLFTNPDSTAEERCILCYDSVGFGSYKGVDGCKYCLPPLSGEASAECNWCQNENYGPIDGACTNPGRHACADGACSNCYMSHIQHNGGCYLKTGTIAQKICAANNQFQIVNITACKKCAIDGEVPVDGRCMNAKLEPKCNPHPRAGVCASCMNGGSNYETFLFNGGCYNMHSYIGSQICTKVDANAQCDAWNTGDYGIFKIPNDNTPYTCSDTSVKGVPGCSRCRYDSTKRGPICYNCEYETLAFDGMSCTATTECTGDHKQRRCPGDSERGCECACEEKYYRNGGQCSACAQSCLACNGQDAMSCTLCPPGKVLKYTNDKETGTCVEGCTPNDVCEACGLTVDKAAYCSKCKDPAQYPLNGECTPANNAKTPICLRQFNGACQQCSSGYFLMGGGCYQVDRYPGRFVCKKADGGKCVDTTADYSLDSNGQLVDCSSNCLTCVSGQKTQCLSCHPNTYLKKEGANSYGTCVSRNDCKNGYYASHETVECLPCNIDKCISCHLIDKSILCSQCQGDSLVSLDKRSCIKEPPENAIEFWGGYICDKDSKLSGNVCKKKNPDPPNPNPQNPDPQNPEESKLSTKIGIGIGVGAGIIIVAVIGVLTWWFLSRRKRGPGSLGSVDNMLTSRS